MLFVMSACRSRTVEKSRVAKSGVAFDMSNAAVTGGMCIDV